MSDKLKLSSMQQGLLDAMERHDQGVNPDRDYAGESFEAIKECLGHEDEITPFKKINLTLSTQQRYDIHRYVMDQMQSGAPPHEAANKVVQAVNEFLEEKQEAHNTKGAAKGPIFRRVDG
jgi:hypothetical protein